MRTFIAIEISDGAKSALGQIQAHLKYAGADVKWVENENIHLTMKFLGEVKEDKVEEIKMALDAIGRETKPFEIVLKGIGAFPNIDYPRVIWVGIDKGAAEATEVSRKVDDELLKIGFPKESRPFAAHLTLGRVRSSHNKAALKEKINSINEKLPDINRQSIGSVILFKSTLTPKGSIYTKLHEAKFQGQGSRVEGQG